MVSWALTHSRISMAPFDDGAIVFDAHTGQTHRLSSVYSALLETLTADGECSEARLCQEVFGEYLPEELPGIEQAMKELARLGFVESIIASSVES